MGVELKKFQDEYKKIQTSATAAFGGMKTLTDSMGNTKKVLEGAKLAIGDRVQELRTNGAQGTQLSDFQNDHEVKAALDTASNRWPISRVWKAGRRRSSRRLRRFTRR
jgi:hypothetical protein